MNLSRQSLVSILTERRPPQIRLTTFSPSTIRAVNVGLSLSKSKTTVSFTLQDNIEDADMTASWQRLFAWTLHVPLESQHNEGDISPTGDKGEQPAAGAPGGPPEASSLPFLFF